MADRLYGCIEAGGTKFVCAVASAPSDVHERVSITTADPVSTLGHVVDFFRRMEGEHGAIAAFGVASFGPADVNAASSGWGRILSTPKPGWSGIDICGAIAQAFAVPVGFDTDVNGAVLAEAEWGAAKGASTAAYVTVGTGIGVGIAIDGKAVHGRRHPEMGHIFPRRHSDDLVFTGTCPFHGDCLEGLASGPAIERRWANPLSELGSEEQEIVAFYLGQLAMTLIATLSTGAIVFGGGVLNTPGLLDRIKTAATALNQSYWCADAEIGTIIRAPGLDQNSGLLGALLLAQRANKSAP
ncbi:MAG: ROK family protein [Rhizomicrobium sp.]|nr:ROK family protein [Rhizomicrobium sp.]